MTCTADLWWSQMIKVACLPANQNATLITQPGLKELGFRDQASPLGEFGVKVNNEMAVVPGRILPKPLIKYASSQITADDRASWNMRSVRFHRGGKLEKWGVLVIRDGGRDDFSDENDPALKSIVTGFMDMCRKSGMTVDGQPGITLTANLPRKSQQEPIRSDAVRVIQQTLMSLRERGLAKPKMLLVSSGTVSCSFLLTATIRRSCCPVPISTYTPA
jgi:eukaryotic translation initiation factor 2C